MYVPFLVVHTLEILIQMWLLQVYLYIHTKKKQIIVIKFEKLNKFCKLFGMLEELYSERIMY